MATAKSKMKRMGALGATAVGVVATDFVSDLIPIENQMVKDAAPAVAGFLLLGQKGLVGNMAEGLVIGGIANLVGNFLPVGGFYTQAGMVNGTPTNNAYNASQDANNF